jgi:hypothetical protein
LRPHRIVRAATCSRRRARACGLRRGRHLSVRRSRARARIAALGVRETDGRQNGCDNCGLGCMVHEFSLLMVDE